MSTAIERTLYERRGLTGWSAPDTDQGDPGWPEQASQAVRAINHLTGNGHPIPAPVLYEVLGNLKCVGHMLPQALTQLADGLARSLNQFVVYDTGGDPAGNIQQARQHLAAAARAAADLGVALEAAQSVIASQGYRSHGSDSDL